MYASISKYLNYTDDIKETNIEKFEKNRPALQTPSGPVLKISRPISRPAQQPKKSLKEMITGQKEEFQDNTNLNDSNQINMTWKQEKDLSINNPRIWGPAFWFYLHVSSAYYPENPSQIVRDRMKGRILAIPYELPCASCRQHAIAFIESNRDKLDDIVSSNDKLFRFYVDFHNQVNSRYGKREWTYDEARTYYTGQANINYLTYN